MTASPGTPSRPTIRQTGRCNGRPTGAAIAVARPSGTWLVPADGTAPRRLHETPAFSVSWSPDGTRLVVGTGGGPVDGPAEPIAVVIRVADGASLVGLPMGFSPPVWSPTEDRIALSAPGAGLIVVNPDGTDQLVIGSGYNPTWSPDGSQLLYIRDAASAAWRLLAADGRRLRWADRDRGLRRDLQCPVIPGGRAILMAAGRTLSTQGVTTMTAHRRVSGFAMCLLAATTAACGATNAAPSATPEPTLAASPSDGSSCLPERSAWTSTRSRPVRPISRHSWSTSPRDGSRPMAGSSIGPDGQGSIPPVAVQFWDVDEVFGHPCQWNDTLFQPGPSVDDLAAAIADIPMRNATTPSQRDDRWLFRACTWSGACRPISRSSAIASSQPAMPPGKATATS